MTFSCISCRLQFENAEEQKLHFKSDHHRYNLKRKVLGLEPVTLFEFEQKNPQNVQPIEPPTQQRTKHDRRLELIKEKMELLADLEQDKGWDRVVRKTPQDCLFCKKKFQDQEKMKKHLATHGMNIPDAANFEELVQYLHDKITITNCCIHCNKQFYTIEQTIHHMVSKQHCRLNSEDYERYVETMEGDDWEDEEGSVDDNDSVVELDEDEEELTAYITADETQLVLPNGRVLGSRQFLRYWKQNLKPESQTPQRNTVPGTSGSRELTKVQQQQMLIQRKERKHSQKQAKKELMRENDFRSRVGVKQNLLQHHYREQNPY
jgi:pre-60S factor REI1